MSIADGNLLDPYSKLKLAQKPETLRDRGPNITRAGGRLDCC